MFDSLEGRSAIVTGASKGIGRGLARRFGRAGCHVIVVSRHLLEAERVADEIAAAGGTARGLAADVTSEPDMHEMARAAVEGARAVGVGSALLSFNPPHRFIPNKNPKPEPARVGN